MKIITFLILFITALLPLSAQQTYTISGKVTDNATGGSIESASIGVLNTDLGTLSDSLGYYELCHLPRGNYVLVVQHIGYMDDSIRIVLNENSRVDIFLKNNDVTLREIVLSAKKVILNSAIQIRSGMWDNPEDSFAKLLTTSPGVTTMNIGAGMAKPVVRGLSANRVAVINRGITQQNQQWGADHGMEISQLDVEYAQVYKGPSSLLLGSGTTTAIEIAPYQFKGKDFLSGEATLWGASNNDQIGGALTTQWQKGKWYMRGALSYQDYADYRVPADKFTYHGEDFDLPNKRVPNSAGKENFASGTIGYREKNVTTYFNISNNYQKNGLFEAEHDHDEHDDEHTDENADHDIDTSHSNIGLPYSTANHFTVTNNTTLKTSSLRLLVNTGYQDNHRREFEEFHQLYDGQPTPENDDNIAVDFKLRTYSTNARLFLDEKKTWKKTIGVSAEYQQNRIGGFEYFLPRYNQVSGGAAFINNFQVSDKFQLEAGIRYDLGNMDITGYYDNGLAQHLEDEGYSPSVVDELAQRAYDVNKNFGSWSGSVGAKYNANNDLTLRLNIGKSFRFPSANELAANGIHHAAFRYEIGDPDLKAENGYTFDIGLDFYKYITGLDGRNHDLRVNVSPFVNYYSNFIYLKAIDNPDVMLYDVQPYKYSQAKAIYGGGEYNISWEMTQNIKISSGGSLVLDKNLDDKEPLPFTPPFTMRNEVMFFKNIAWKKLGYYQFSASHQLYTTQNRVGAGEEETPGTNLFNLSAGFDYKFSKKWLVRFNVQVQNVFDTRYLNHMSLYRRLNIPEPGRNIQVFVRIPFGG